MKEESWTVTSTVLRKTFTCENDGAYLIAKIAVARHDSLRKDADWFEWQGAPHAASSFRLAAERMLELLQQVAREAPPSPVLALLPKKLLWLSDHFRPTESNRQKGECGQEGCTSPAVAYSYLGCGWWGIRCAVHAAEEEGGTETPKPTPVSLPKQDSKVAPGQATACPKCGEETPPEGTAAWYPGTHFYRCSQGHYWEHDLAPKETP